MASSPWWSSENFWLKTAIWVTALMLFVLMFLTFDSIATITAESDRVPVYSVLNYQVAYGLNDESGYLVPAVTWCRCRDVALGSHYYREG